MKEPTKPSCQLNLVPLYILTLVVCAVVLYVRIRLLDVPLERDEGEFAYMGQLMLKGIPPYANAYTMKLPGTAMIYAVLMGLFGQSPVAIHLGFLLVNGASAALVFLLGRSVFGQEEGLIAAVFYCFLSLSASVMGVFAHATHLVVFFSTAGIIILQQGLEKGNRTILFLAGVLFGMAFLMKQHAAIMIPFALLFQIWPSHAGTRKTGTMDMLIFIGGAALPGCLVCIWLYHSGVFERFWFWTFQYALTYASSQTLATGLVDFHREASAIIKANLPIWLLAAGATATLHRADITRQNKLFLAGLLGASCVMVAQGLYFRPHYFVMMLPIIAILAARGTVDLVRLSTCYRSTMVLVLIVIAGYFCVRERRYLFLQKPAEVSRSIYGTNPFPEARAIGNYLRKHTTRQDKIAVLGSEPEFFFYANRLSASGHIYMYGLMENHRYAEEMQRQFIAEIEASAPTFIVVVNNAASWLLKADSANRILDWGDDYIPLRYDEVGMVEIYPDQPSRFIWEENVAGREPATASFVSVFKKR